MKNIKDVLNTDIDVMVNDIKTNTKEINKGDAFVCIKGFNVDRHDYVSEAEKKGASLLIVDHDVDSNLPQIKVDNTNEALVDIVTKFYDYPSTKMNMIGVTGTDGKTSTSTIIYTLLNQKIKTGYIGTNGVESPTYKDDSNNTTPTIEHLQRFLNNFYKDGCKCVCMEAASEALAQDRCKTIMYDYSIFTNLTHEHLNYHKTMENYLDAKGKLFNQTKKEGYCIINSDDEYALEISKKCNGHVVYYGSSDNALFRFSDVVITSEYTKFNLNYNNKVYNIKMPLLGMFNVYNMTAALSVLLLMGYDINEFDFSSLKVDGRLTNIDLGQDFKVIVDYAHTPNGYVNLFNFINKLEHNKIIVVAGTAGERDKTKRPVMGSLLTSYADKVIFTYEDPRSEEVDDIIDDLLKDVKTNNYERVIDRKDAIKRGIDIASTGDIVLILGKGNETYETLKDGKIYFNDVEEARNSLKEKLKVEV